MELSKTQNQIRNSEKTVSGFSPNEEGQVITWLTSMFDSLNVYGKKWTTGIAQGWLMALRLSPEITVADFQGAAAHWLANESEFPTPHKFFAWIREKREREAMRQELADMAAVIRDYEAAELRRKNLQVYGTENPTKEQVNERLKAFHQTDEANRFQPDRQDLVDDDQIRHIRNQINDIRGFE